MSHIAEADRQYAYAIGEQNPDWAWVLSDRDVWYPNPHYSGPPVPHPESEWQGTDEEYRQMLAGQTATPAPVQPDDDDVPF